MNQITDFNFRELRKDSFNRWCQNQQVPGFSNEFFSAIFDYIFSKQDKDSGTWPHKDWEVVQTAVVLKSLAALGFGAGDQWTYEVKGIGVAGGIRKPLEFLCDKLQKAGKGGVVGEDNWDTCQALLAIAAFGRKVDGAEIARDIVENWRVRYAAEVNSTEPNIWCGPSYLAAMIDVFLVYSVFQDNDHSTANLQNALEQLTKLEQVDGAGKPTGCFPACTSSSNHNRWNTGLVLRTLCGVGHKQPALLDRSLIQRSVGWLLNEANGRSEWANDHERSPMFRSRCLEGLNAALPYVSDELARGVKRVMKSFNERIESELKADGGSLKTRTAVGEYLAELNVNIPAALLFEVGHILSEESDCGSEPTLKLDGLTIVWLSDLHVAEQGDEYPYGKTNDPGFFGDLRFLRRNALTETFQSQNLDRILQEVANVKPAHILITGDLTNWALPNQFRRVQNLLMMTQVRMNPSGENKKLEANLWTILPGNHDASGWRPGGERRRHLKEFFSYFGDTFHNLNLTGGNFEEVFPHRKLVGKMGDRPVRIIALDSTVPWPVSAVGINAQGRLDGKQLKRLGRMLSEERDHLTLVSLHHHPVTVPEIASKWEDFFLSLHPGDARELLKHCVSASVPAILHGHYHVYSHWFTATRRLQVIGASSGTLCIPADGGEEFFVLREASLRGQSGLALYKRKHEGSAWTERYCAFIPSQPLSGKG